MYVIYIKRKYEYAEMIWHWHRSDHAHMLDRPPQPWSKPVQLAYAAAKPCTEGSLEHPLNNVRCMQIN